MSSVEASIEIFNNDTLFKLRKISRSVFMIITMIGTGYVGLVTGTCLAETGHSVTCVDIDPVKIDKLNQGILPIYEPGLQELVETNVQKGKLSFTTDLSTVVPRSDVVIIAVGTPPGGDGSTDLRFVLAAAKDIAQHITGYTVIVTKSTVPVHTAQKVHDVIYQELAVRGDDSVTFDVVSNPEFLKEGNSVQDFLKPDRIIVGTSSKPAEAIMRKLYYPFIINGHPFLVMDLTSAELTKYAANAMLATRITFMNEMANLCEAVGADINWVRKGIGSDPRIGSQFLYPGTGYGGSCFPKDVKSIIHTGREFGSTMYVLEAVEAVNSTQKTILFSKLATYFEGRLQGKKIAVWGLSFKPRTDDMREAPSVDTIKRLVAAGCEVTAYDPVAIENAKHSLGDSITYVGSQYEALHGADCLVIFTEWSEFRSPDFDRMHDAMVSPVIFDGRNILNSEDVKENGFIYFGIGIPPVTLG